MTDRRLVRVSVLHNGDGVFLGYVWGLFDQALHDEGEDQDCFFALYTRSKRVTANLCGVGESTSLSHPEVESAVNVDECWTPSCVYVEAAKIALAGN